ncbi:MAG: signal peptidase II [Alphaproteobacteria bacterium]|nr:signal peptidase II [Alphaproteobacteria bacterium]
MRVWALLLVILIVIIDQISKKIIIGMIFNPYRVIEVTSFFNLVPVYNTGISFGLFNTGSELGRWILVLVAIALIIVLFIWLFRTKSVYVVICLVLVLGGALSNLVDRIIIGAVIDFLDFHLLGFHWPAFNLADSCIVIGALLLLYKSLYLPTQKRSD